jgi:nitrate/nitrite transport system substrate-binding protein
MKRWGYIESDVNYRQIGEQVYLAGDTAKIMMELRYELLTKTYAYYTIMGKEFGHTQPKAYVNSFAIWRM